jgi:hypothetical protein
MHVSQRSKIAIRTDLPGPRMPASDEPAISINIDAEASKFLNTVLTPVLVCYSKAYSRVI